MGETIREFRNSELGDNIEFSHINITPECLHATTETILARSTALIDYVVYEAGLTRQEILDPLSEANDLLCRGSAYLDNVKSLHPKRLVRDTAAEVQADFSERGNAYLFDYDYGKKVHAYARSTDARSLPPEYQHYLHKTLRELQLSGYGLNRRSRQKLKKAYSLLWEQQYEFLENINHDKKILSLTDEELAGLSAKKIAKISKKYDGIFHRITVDDPSFDIILRDADNRQTRARFHEAYYSRAKDQNIHVLEKLLKNRQKIAKTLGYESWADMVLADSMIGSRQALENLYHEILVPITEQAQNEIVELTSLLIADGESPPLQAYDLDYYTQKLAVKVFGEAPKNLNDYLSLEGVMNELFTMGSVIGLNFSKATDKVWHPDVETFIVHDTESGKHLATIHFDLLPRKGKTSEVYSGVLSYAKLNTDGSRRPFEGVLVANLQRNTKDESAMVSTKFRKSVMFHEFGHLLHDTVTDFHLMGPWAIGNEMDYIEIPSKIAELWATSQNALSALTNYKTGEVIPELTARRLSAATRISSGLRMLFDLSGALMDLELHSVAGDVDIKQIWQKATDIVPIPTQPGTFDPSCMEHLATDYAGAYHTYVMGPLASADIFDHWQTEGLSDAQAGKKLRKLLLQPGSSMPGSEMLKNYLGREPTSQAFLRSLGIAATAES